MRQGGREAERVTGAVEGVGLVVADPDGDGTGQQVEAHGREPEAGRQRQQGKQQAPRARLKRQPRKHTNHREPAAVAATTGGRRVRR